MMNKKLILTAAAVLIAMGLLVFYTNSPAKENAHEKFRVRLMKPEGVVGTRFIGANNWRYAMLNNGTFMYDYYDVDANRVNAGGEFPRGSGVTIIFAGGIWIGTLKNGLPVVSEVVYSSEFQPGRILNDNVAIDQLIAETPDSAVDRTYIIDSTKSGSDWEQWPGLKRNDGEPALISGAQTWSVFNDLNLSLNHYPWFPDSTAGIGVEVTLESFNLNSGDAANSVFFKLSIKNKTDHDYPNTYLGLFVDADIDASYSSNDIVGCDTTKDLGFIYNGDESDLGTDGFSRCAGVGILQGSVADTSEIPVKEYQKFQNHRRLMVYDPVENRYSPQMLDGDQVILGMTSFFGGIKGNEGGGNNRQRYNSLIGKFADGSPRAGTGFNDYYNFRGDPFGPNAASDLNVAKSHDEADQHTLTNSGPFTLKAGVAREIWFTITGGIGTSRLNALASMMQNFSFAKVVFNAGLTTPVPPETPKMFVTSSNKSVIVSWQNNAESGTDAFGEYAGLTMANGYTNDYRKYDFEGYRVWKSLTALPGSWQQLAQYDLADGITKINNVAIDDHGALKIEQVDLGTDTGLQYYFVDNDALNGQKYFYSVTAYDAQPYIGGPGTISAVGSSIPAPNGLPISLESSPTANATSAVPHADTLTSHAAHADTLIHTSGSSDATVIYRVIDPAKIKGGTYSIQFGRLPAVSGTGKKLTDLTGALSSTTTIYRVYNQNLPVPFSDKTDDPRTFYDTDSDGVFAAGIDSALDDTYFSTTIYPSYFPYYYDGPLAHYNFFDGLQIAIVEDAGGFNSVTYESGPQYAVSGLTFPHRRTWFQGADYSSQNPAPGIWDNSQYPEFGISSPAGEDPSTGGVGTLYLQNAGVNFGGPFKSMDPFLLRNFDVVFSRDSTKWSYTYTTGGGSGSLVNYERVPWRVVEVDGADGDAAPRLLCTSMRERNLAGSNAQAWGTYNGGFGTSNIVNDGTGPQTRGYFGVDSSTNDLTGKTGGYGALSGGEKLNGVNLFGDSATASYAVCTFQARQIISKNGATDGLDWVNFAKTVFNGSTTVNQGQQGTIYRQLPDEGTIHVKFYHSLSNDVFSLETTAPQTKSKTQVKNTLKNIRVVPNPFYIFSRYDTGTDKLIKFVNLPDVCTIRIYTVAGDMVRKLEHNSGSNNDRVNTSPLDSAFVPDPLTTSLERWDLKNVKGHYVASGIYIALIDVPHVGTRTVKFAVIQ